MIFFHLVQNKTREGTQFYILVLLLYNCRHWKSSVFNNHREPCFVLLFPNNEDYVSSSNKLMEDVHTFEHPQPPRSLQTTTEQLLWK